LAGAIARAFEIMVALQTGHFVLLARSVGNCQMLFSRAIAAERRARGSAWKLQGLNS